MIGNVKVMLFCDEDAVYISGYEVGKIQNDTFKWQYSEQCWVSCKGDELIVICDGDYVGSKSGVA